MKPYATLEIRITNLSVLIENEEILHHYFLTILTNCCLFCQCFFFRKQNFRIVCGTGKTFFLSLYFNGHNKATGPAKTSGLSIDIILFTVWQNLRCSILSTFLPYHVLHTNIKPSRFLSVIHFGPFEWSRKHFIINNYFLPAGFFLIFFLLLVRISYIRKHQNSLK